MPVVPSFRDLPARSNRLAASSPYELYCTVALGELVSQACDPSIIRNLAEALDDEADAMESDPADY